VDQLPGWPPSPDPLSLSPQAPSCPGFVARTLDEGLIGLNLLEVVFEQSLGLACGRGARCFLEIRKSGRRDAWLGGRVGGRVAWLQQRVGSSGGSSTARNGGGWFGRGGRCAIEVADGPRIDVVVVGEG